MSIYQEILDWSQNKNDFIKDALRRIISKTSLSPSDITELINLVKKEKGDISVTASAIPFNSSHFPTAHSATTTYPRLLNIKDPKNICALYDQTNLTFDKDGLTVIYGNNGSGKSSFARILKKLCWSRNPSIELKTNVFTPSSVSQAVEFLFDINGTAKNIQWSNGVEDSALKSIYVFDSDCANVYLNNENPSEYKPVGIDVLERLIDTLNLMTIEIEQEKSSYNSSKPIIDNTLSNSNLYSWYQQVENKPKAELTSTLLFSQVEKDRKEELVKLLQTENPQDLLNNLNNTKRRLSIHKQKFKSIEEAFHSDRIKELKELKQRSINIKNTYDLATKELQEINTIDEFGSDSWRALWLSAKNFAITSKMTTDNNFPSGSSLDKCVLCQQDLDSTAQKRLTQFNEFVENDISSQLNAIEVVLSEKLNSVNAITLDSHESFQEITDHNSEFEESFESFEKSLNQIKLEVSKHLTDDTPLNSSIEILSIKIDSILLAIDEQIASTNTLIQGRTTLESELLELKTKEALTNHKTQIEKYYNDVKAINWLSECISALSTTGISRKIGSLMEEQAVNLQHQEFINHLTHFSTDLASKVQLSKTRTSRGSTFQQCQLTGVGETIDSILSEGEQKIVALSNFIGECTIDNKENTIVFDDPVTSLDMDYRDLIAQKIVELSSNRQVIVLTHDLSFMRLLIDTHKSVRNTDCALIGIDKYEGKSGIVTDEIPYLAKNVQERINSIRRILDEHDQLAISDSHGREVKLDSARKRFRMLLERSVEEILSNKTYERFSKNIHLKKGNLSSYIVTEQSDIDLLLNLFGKYSITEHDGGTSTIPMLPSKDDIKQDLRDYSDWKDGFKSKLSTFKQTYV